MPSTEYESAAFPWDPSNQTATQIYPRPDAETPAWAFHRVHYYDGVNSVSSRIPIQPRGGSFPWNFVIIQAPAAANATLGASSWVLGWAIADATAAGYGDLVVTPSAAYSNELFWVRAYDQEGNYQDFKWTASTVAGYDATNKMGFVFLNYTLGVDPATYPTSGVSSNFSSPIKTFNWAFGATNTTTTYPNAILVIAGSPIPAFAQSSSYGMPFAPGYGPMAIVAASGASVSIDCTSAGTLMAFDVGTNATDVFVQGFSMINVPAASTNFRHIAAPNGNLGNHRFFAHNISFPNIQVGSSPTANAGPIQFDATAVGVNRLYIGIKGITQTNMAGGANVFSILNTYTCQYVVAFLCSATNSNGNNPGGVMIKASTSDWSVTASKVVLGTQGESAFALFAQWNGTQSKNGEIDHCILDNSQNGYGGWAPEVNMSYSASVPAAEQTFGPVYATRCSILGAVDVDTPAGNGPVYLRNCAIELGTRTQPVYINRAAGTVPSNVTNSGTECQAASGVFNSPSAGDYSFATAYAAYQYERGAVILS